MLAAMPLALLAGLVSFLSPCVLPLVPGFIGFVSGTAAPKARVLLASSLFVLGFTAVFVSLGVAAGGLGNAIAGNAAWIERVLGLVIIVLGFVLIGGLGFLQRTAKFSVSPKLGLWGAPLLGIAFGLGWTPCVGPTLSAVLALSLDGATAGRGALLSVLYSLGIGLPFLAIAAGFSWATKSVNFVKQHIRAFNMCGGVLLIVLGVLMATGLWSAITTWLQGVTGAFIPAV
jgi:cytochrome c-type biogenesis protein